MKCATWLQPEARQIQSNSLQSTDVSTLAHVGSRAEDYPHCSHPLAALLLSVRRGQEHRTFREQLSHPIKYVILNAFIIN